MKLVWRFLTKIFNVNTHLYIYLESGYDGTNYFECLFTTLATSSAILGRPCNTLISRLNPHNPKPYDLTDPNLSM